MKAEGNGVCYCTGSNFCLHHWQVKDTWIPGTRCRIYGRNLCMGLSKKDSCPKELLPESKLPKQRAYMIWPFQKINLS